MRKNGTGNGGIVYVIDDDEDVRSSIQALLAELDQRVETFATVDGFRSRFDPQAVSCLVLDVRLPGTSGLTFQRQMRDDGIELPIIVITGHGDVQMAVEALRDGAFDFIEKPCQPQLLIDRIQSALAECARSRQAEMERDALRRRWSRLTPREGAVVREILTGDQHKMIAARLGVTPQAIDGHRTRIFRKLEVTNLAELVRLAVRIGIEAAHGPDRPDQPC